MVSASESVVGNSMMMDNDYVSSRPWYQRDLRLFGMISMLLSVILFYSAGAKRNQNLKRSKLLLVLGILLFFVGGFLLLGHDWIQNRIDQSVYGFDPRAT